jgi:hypothetical protein
MNSENARALGKGDAAILDADDFTFVQHHLVRGACLQWLQVKPGFQFRQMPIYA